MDAGPVGFAGTAPPLQTLTTPESVRAPFDAAVVRYTTRLVRVSTTLADTQQEAARKYFESADQRLRQQREATVRGHDALSSAVHPGSTGSVAPGQTDSFASLQAVENAAREATTAAFADLVVRVHAAWQEAQAESQAAYREYVSDVAVAFAGLPVDAVDPATLSFIAQGLASAAGYGSLSMHAAAATLAEMQRQFGPK